MEENKNIFFIVNQGEKSTRLDVFLQEKLQLTRSQIKNLIDNGNIVVNEKVVKAGYSLKTQDEVLVKSFTLPQINLEPQNIEIDIVFEDENFAIVNKPQGMVVHPAAGNYDGTLVNALMFHLKTLSASQDVRPGIVHRLDKNTSGLLIVAKNNKTHNYFSSLIKQHKVVKKYLAICNGYFKHMQGEIVTGIARDKKNRKKMAVYNQDEGRLAITRYKVVEELNGHTLVEFELITGRTHQIRVHASSLKHAIVGDEVYGGNTKLYNKGQLLHSHYLEFISPTTLEKVVFTAQLPEGFSKVLAELR